MSSSERGVCVRESTTPATPVAGGPPGPTTGPAAMRCLDIWQRRGACRGLGAAGNVGAYLSERWLFALQFLDPEDRAAPLGDVHLKAVGGERLGVAREGGAAVFGDEFETTFCRNVREDARGGAFAGAAVN